MLSTTLPPTPTSSVITIPYQQPQSPSAPEDALMLASGAVIGRTGLTFRETPTLAQWEQTCDIVLGMRSMAQWALLDLTKLGRSIFGDGPVAEAMRRRKVQQADLDEVFKLEPIVERRADLTPEHHYAVAQLDPIDQKRWLELAKIHDLSPRSLRASIRANDIVRSDAEHPIDSKSARVTGTETYLSVLNEFSRWYTRAEPQVKAWPPQRIAAALEDLEPIGQFIDWLRARRHAAAAAAGDSEKAK